MTLNSLAGEFLKVVPNIVGALLVLIVGYLVARFAKTALRAILTKTHLDETVKSSPAGNIVGKVAPSVAAVVSSLAFWVVLIGAASLAVSVLGISALTGFVAAIYAYLPNVIAAFLILVAAIVVSAAISGLVSRAMGDTATGKLIASIVPGLVFSVAIFMVLNQLQIAPAIVTITYAAIVGSLALGSALAFGLGGRDLAAQALQQAQTKASRHMDQARQDLALGRERSQAMVSDLKQNLQPQTQTEAAPTQEAPAPMPTPGFVPAPMFGESIESFQQEHSYNQNDQNLQPKPNYDPAVEELKANDYIE